MITLDLPFRCAFCLAETDDPFVDWPLWWALIDRKTGCKTYLCSRPCLANHTAALAGDPVQTPR